MKTKTIIPLFCLLTSGVCLPAVAETMYFTGVQLLDTYHYAPGAWQTTITSENQWLVLNLGANNWISDITLRPIFNVFNDHQSWSEKLSYEMVFSWYVSETGLAYKNTRGVRPTLESVIITGLGVKLDDDPAVWAGPHTFNVSTDYNNNARSFSDYRLNHLADEQTIQFGFELVSIEYTAVPEPSTFALIGCSLLGVGCWMIRKRYHPSAA